MRYTLCTWYSAHREAPVTPQARNHPLADNPETSNALTPTRRNRRAFLFPRKFVPACDIIRLCWRTVSRRQNAALSPLCDFARARTRTDVYIYMYYVKYGVKWCRKITERLTGWRICNSWRSSRLAKGNGLSYIGNVLNINILCFNKFLYNYVFNFVILLKRVILYFEKLLLKCLFWNNLKLFWNKSNQNVYINPLESFYI